MISKSLRVGKLGEEEFYIENLKNIRKNVKLILVSMDCQLYIISLKEIKSKNDLKCW